MPSWRDRSIWLLLPALASMLLLAVTSLCSLVQFPYTISVYFGYVAPLVVLLSVVLYKHARLPDRLPEIWRGWPYGGERDGK